MSKPVRWGVLGASNFARKHMARAILVAEGAELAALATSSAEKAAGFLAFAPGIKVHNDYDSLLADPTIEAVYIPLPNHLHVEWAIKALDAGKHVLCEKPLAMSADQFDAVIAKRDETGLLAAEAFMIVHHPQFHTARDMVQSGVIGPIRHVDSVFTYDNRTALDNIRNRADTGGGALPDIGVYPYGATRFVLGTEPTDLAAVIDYENGVDVYSHVTGRFGSATASFVVSMRMQASQFISFHGEGGRITLTAPYNANVFGDAVIELERESGKIETQRFTTANHYVTQVENFGQAIRSGAAYACPLEFSKGTQAMIDQIYAVARS